MHNEALTNAIRDLWRVEGTYVRAVTVCGIAPLLPYAVGFTDWLDFKSATYFRPCHRRNNTNVISNKFLCIRTVDRSVNLPWKAKTRQPNLMRILLRIVLGLALLSPTLAQAHTVGTPLNSWQEGFNHPLHGWDHLLAMLAVGIWAAQQRGRAVWLIPLTFIVVMSLGGIVGASGVSVPGIELAISLSVVVLVALVARRVRLRAGFGAALVGFFAFFHGFAHGVEMTGSTSLLTFGLGFVAATLLLHGAGLVGARGITVALAFLVTGSVTAQEATNEEIVVEGRGDSLIGLADSASEGTVGARQIEDRPIMRAGEILETVPGIIVTQHAGGGKANQYFCEASISITARTSRRRSMGCQLTCRRTATARDT